MPLDNPVLGHSRSPTYRPLVGARRAGGSRDDSWPTQGGSAHPWGPSTVQTIVLRMDRAQLLVAEATPRGEVSTANEVLRIAYTAASLGPRRQRFRWMLVGWQTDLGLLGGPIVCTQRQHVPRQASNAG